MYVCIIFGPSTGKIWCPVYPIYHGIIGRNFSVSQTSTLSQKYLFVSRKLMPFPVYSCQYKLTLQTKISIPPEPVFQNTRYKMFAQLIRAFGVNPKVWGFCLKKIPLLYEWYGNTVTPIDSCHYRSCGCYPDHMGQSQRWQGFHSTQRSALSISNRFRHSPDYINQPRNIWYGGKQSIYYASYFCLMLGAFVWLFRYMMPQNVSSATSAGWIYMYVKSIVITSPDFVHLMIIC